MKVGIAIFTSLILFSCDPMQTLELENKSHSVATIKFYFTGDNYSKFNDFITEDSLVLTLIPAEKKRYDFGIGTWEIHHSLDSLVARVTEIKIETLQSTQLFKGQAQIESFFKNRIIKDRYKNRILIELE